MFNDVFFPDSDRATGTLLAVATFGVGYAARPVGAFVLGHVGDRLGRKKVLVFTLLLMGVATFLVGCLPTYHQIGVLAPVLLVVLRLLQGLSVPFLASAVVVVVGYVIRRRLEETPVFKHQVATTGVARLPLADLFRDHWRDVLRVVLASLIASVSTIFTVYALSYAVNTVELERTPMLWVGVLANAVALVALPLCATLADRIGRKPMFVAGSLGCAVLMFAYLGAISAGNYPMIFLVGILMFGVVYSATNGIWPAFYGEMFPTQVRLSGMAIGTQIGFAIAGFSPTIAAALDGEDGTNWVPVAVFTAALCAINVVAVASARETHRVPTERLGTTHSRSSATHHR